jgi:hypothetical protein
MEFEFIRFMKGIVILLISSIGTVFCQQNIPLFYDASAHSYPSFLQTNYLLNEGSLKKQGAIGDSMVYESKGKMISSYVWHYDKNKKITYHAYHRGNIEHLLYTKTARYDQNGNMTEYVHLDASKNAIDRRTYEYDTQGRVIAYQKYPGSTTLPEFIFKVTYDCDSIFTIFNQLTASQDGVYCWRYTVDPHMNIIAIAYLDSNNTILHSSRIRKRNPTEVPCADSVSKKTIQHFNSKTNEGYYRIEQIYLDQYQPEIFMPYTNGLIDTQNVEVKWIIERADVLMEEKKYDMNDKLINHTKYYNDFTVSLKSYDMKPERVVYKTEEIFDPSGRTDHFITYFRGGSSKMQYFYNSTGALEKIWYYINKKLNHNIYYFSF